jgi:dienelactone hydrolase
MTDLQVFEYRHDDLALFGLLAWPRGPGPHPAVLVMRDALALGQVVSRRAHDLAAAGYVALVTDMYGVGPGEPQQAEASRMFGELQQEPERLRGRVLAAYDALRALEGVDASRISAIGYCFGGQCVFELARSGADVRSVVSFHGLMTTKLPAQPGAVKARVLAITGALDPYAPLSDVEGFQKEMSQAGADWHLTVYGQAMHAFTDPQVCAKTDIPGLKYDPLLDRLSWSQATAFLEAASG